MALGSKVLLLFSPLALAAACFASIDRDRIGEKSASGGANVGGAAGSAVGGAAGFGVGGSGLGGTAGSGGDAGIVCTPAPCDNNDPKDNIVCPGESIQAAVDNNAVGATITIKAGIHRNQTVVAKPGNTFEGEPCAVLSGAKVLTEFEKVGNLWLAKNQDQQNPVLPNGEDCYTGEGWQAGLFKNWPNCMHPEDLYIDDVPLRHVASQADVTSGTWWFDYPNDTIYFADDPTGHRVETSVTPIAFDALVNAADQVTIRGLVIEKYAAYAAIAFSNSNQWTIENNELRLNHAWAINGYTGQGHKIIDNDIHNNGMGFILGGKATGTLIDNNDFTNNDNTGDGWPGISSTYANAILIEATNGTVMHLNRFKGNGGSAIQLVTDNYTYTIDQNQIELNIYSGIAIHSSCAGGIVKNNVIINNGSAGIAVLRSNGIEIFGNQLSGNGSTFFSPLMTSIDWAFQIGLTDSGGDYSADCHTIKDVNVHDNNVTVSGQVKAVDLENDYKALGLGVQFVNNTYDLTAAVPEPFHIGATFYSLPGWQGKGYN